MVFYEMMLLLRPDLGQEDIDAALERVQEILRRQDGEIVHVDVWGKRRLAYEIEDHREGHYTLFHYEATPEAVRELERLLKLDERVLRYLVVRAEKPEFEPPAEEEEAEAGETRAPEEEATASPAAAGEAPETSVTAETEAAPAETPVESPAAPAAAEAAGDVTESGEEEPAPETETPAEAETPTPDQAESAEEPLPEQDSAAPQDPLNEAETENEVHSPEQAAEEGPEPQDPDKVG